MKAPTVRLYPEFLANPIAVGASGTAPPLAADIVILLSTLTVASTVYNASVARDRLFRSVHTYRIIRRGNASHSRAFAGSVTAVFWSESVVSFFSDFRFAIPVSVTPV